LLLRRLAVAAVAALALAACGGAAGDDTAAGDATDEEVLDTSETLPPNDGDEPPLTSGMCAEGEPDCQDTIADGAAAGGAAGSCLAGDEDCTDESYGGQDVTRPVPLAPESSGAPALEEGLARDATGAPIDAVYAVDETTLEVTFTAGTCHLLQDVLVDESPAEVRLLVLAGMDPAVEMCTADVRQWTTTVDLAGPLGDRAVLDLAG
jgi:hypothetical protein